jgi:hypothetical protein
LVEKAADLKSKADDSAPRREPAPTIHSQWMGTIAVRAMSTRLI